MSESSPAKPINIQPTGNAYERPVARVFDLYLTGVIGEPKEYQDWNQILRMSSEHDAVIIHINSEGGAMFTAIQLMKAMAESPATVIASVEGMCMSAATLIFLSAEVCEISEHSHFMFHTYSSGNWGKGNEQIANVQADDKWARHLFQSVYKDFLTPQELKQMVDGKDFWMTPSEVTKRLETRNKKIKRTRGPKAKQNALQKA